MIILEAEFELTAKDPNEIKIILDKRKERRMSSQPWNMPSAGSVFRNHENKAAWQYIDECGLRGYEIGGAQISPKHSNFMLLIQTLLQELSIYDYLDKLNDDKKNPFVLY